MCIPHSVAFVFSTLEPFRTRKPEEHQLRSLFPLPRRVKTQKQAKFRKQYPDVSMKTNQSHLLIVE